MTYALVAALAAAQAITGVVVWLFLRHVSAEREQAFQQIADLCQRIQAPEAAVVAYDRVESEPQPPVFQDDDNSWWLAQGVDPALSEEN